jgi:hypothetical protein
VEPAGGNVEVFEHPGSGHLVTDASLPEEYDATAATLRERVLPFVNEGRSRQA